VSGTHKLAELETRKLALKQRLAQHVERLRAPPHGDADGQAEEADQPTHDSQMVPGNPVSEGQLAQLFWQRNNPSHGVLLANPEQPKLFYHPELVLRLRELASEVYSLHTRSGNAEMQRDSCRWSQLTCIVSAMTGTQCANMAAGTSPLPRYRSSSLACHLAKPLEQWSSESAATT